MLTKGDTVELINQGAFKTNYGHVHRAAKDGSWADVILGKYACYRFNQTELKKVAPRCKICGMTVEVTSNDGYCMACCKDELNRLYPGKLVITGALAEIVNKLV